MAYSKKAYKERKRRELLSGYVGEFVTKMQEADCFNVVVYYTDNGSISSSSGCGDPMFDLEAAGWFLRSSLTTLKAE